MALWKEATPQARPAPQPVVAEPVIRRDDPTPTSPQPHLDPSRRPTMEARESVIGSNLTIEGKIQGAGHVRLAGKFKGDVHVDGNLTIDNGAVLTGSIRAETVTIAGQVDGNIVEAKSVELLSSGVLNGDLKAGTLTVAAGSRMRGNVEFGWKDTPPHRGDNDKT